MREFRAVVPSTAKKATSSDQHPLDWFLGWIEDEHESRLAFLAREVAAKPFDADVFRSELTTKLTRLRYPQPDRELGIGKKTFYEILEQAGVLDVLLDPDTLRELWKSRLVSEILRSSRELESKQKSVEGIPLAEHWGKVRKIRKDLKTFERIAREYSLEEHMGNSCEKIAGRILHEIRPILTSMHTGSKEELLLGIPTVPRWKAALQAKKRRIRNENSAIQVNIYRTLQSRLQSTETKRKGIFDIFLCQLSELVWHGPSAQGLTDGETLRKAVKRLRG